MLIRNLDEGIGIALDALRSNKLRSTLTILGVVIGVTTVMAIASMVQGIRTQTGPCGTVISGSCAAGCRTPAPRKGPY